MIPKSNRTDVAAEQGFIIVAVLWILAALAALATIFAIYLSNTAQALAVSDTAVEAEGLVSASVELTAYQLLLSKPNERAADGSFQFRLGHGDVVVSFVSEGGVSISMGRRSSSWPTCSRSLGRIGSKPTSMPNASSPGGLFRKRIPLIMSLRSTAPQVLPILPVRRRSPMRRNWRWSLGCPRFWSSALCRSSRFLQGRPRSMCWWLRPKSLPRCRA